MTVPMIRVKVSNIIASVSLMGTKLGSIGAVKIEVDSPAKARLTQ